MNKSFFLACALAAGALSASADLNGEGYYRIKNNKTDRYVYIVDNKGWLNMSSTSAELKAIELWLDDGTVVSDPATVMHIVPQGSQYNVQAQGTGVYEIIELYVNVREDKRTPHTYWAYGSKQGMVLYLADLEDDTTSWPDGIIETVNYDTPNRNWKIEPITAESADNYFGVKPTVSAGGKNLASVYADFSFTTTPGIKACFITKIDKSGYAVYREVSDGKVPARTPVFFICNSGSAADNKLEIGTADNSKIEGNLLRGVFFNCNKYNHVNHVAWNKTTMRALGVTAEGKPGFVSADYDYVPRNIAYLPVDADTPAQLTLVSEEEYAAGINDVVTDTPAFDIYTTTGVKVRSGATDYSGLPAGIYIANGRKVIVHE